MLSGLFATELEEKDGVLCGPFRIPRQMLAEQTYDAICPSTTTAMRRSWALAARR